MKDSNNNQKCLKLVLCLFLIAIMLLSGIACNQTTANLGHEFSLYIGESARIQGEELQLKFLNVIGDSRCPKGATCVWQGEVSCTVEITYYESLHRLILTQPGLTDEPSSQPFEEYQITFHLEPYPEVGRTISENEYQLLLVVHK
jgi:hypothetical protein